MENVIEKWIQFRLGILINNNQNIFAKSLCDGVLLAKILYSHCIIVFNELSLITASENECVMRNNFKYIKSWLNAIDVDCDDECVSNVISCDAKEALMLLYRTYLSLLDKNCLKLNTLKLIKAQMIYVSSSRFKVTKVEEESINTPTSKFNCISYIEDNQHIINWEKVRKEVLLKRCKDSWEVYFEYVKNKIKDKPRVTKEKLDNNVKFYRSGSEINIDVSYKKLQGDIIRVDGLDPFVPLKTKSVRLVRGIQERNTSKEKENSLKEHLMQNFVIKATNGADILYIKEFEESVKRKVLLQSFFEKQMSGLMINLKEVTNSVVSEHTAAIEGLLDKEIERNSLFFEDKKKDVRRQRKNLLLYELERKLELTKRLFEEQKALECRRNHNLCRDIVNNLVDVAIRHGEYSEKYGRPALWRLTRMWMFLIVKGQSAFDVLDNIADIVCYDYNKDIDEELSEKMLKEIERQNMCDQSYVEAFWNMQYPFSDFCKEGFFDLDLIAKRNNILGYIVFRLLLVKYPRPSLPSTAELPPVSYAASIVGINNLQFISLLQQMLVGQNIKVIQIEEAINYCLAAYKEEYYEPLVQQSFIETTKETLKSLEDKRTGKKGKVKNRWKKGEKFIDRREFVIKVPQEFLPPFSQKTTQTPDVFPCNETVFTRKAQLGKYAYELLNLGDQLPNRLLTEIFAEYLKSLKNIKGWVLVNYPRTMEEAVLLEEALTGKECLFDHSIIEDYPCVEDLTDLELRTLNIYPEYDSNKKFRKCRLFSNPISIEPNKYYESYITSYIVLKQTSKSKEKPKDLKQFYVDKGTYYDFEYDKFDFRTLKQLGKLILKQPSEKPSLEVFGETIAFLENNIPDNVGGSLKIEKRGKKLIKPKEIKQKDMMGENDKASQVPEKEDEYIIITETNNCPEPGEPNWNYVDVPIPQALAEMLATIWETIEETYTSNQQNSLFKFRIALDNDYPILYYREQLLQLYSRYPANKQILVDQFQKFFNEFDDDMRHDIESKAEIHYKIEELRQNLLAFTEKNFQQALNMMDIFLKDVWLSEFLYLLIHICINGFQIELEKHVNTTRFMTDYYSALVTKKIRLDVIYEDPHLQTNINVDSPQFREFYDTVQEYLHSDIGKSSSINFFINKHYRASLACVEETKRIHEKVFAEIEAELQRLDSNKKDTKNLILDSDLKEQRQALLDEWKCAMNGEYQNTINALHVVLNSNMGITNSTLEKHKKSSEDNLKLIMKRNLRERKQIEEICWVFGVATESESKLQPRFVLEGDEFYIQPDVITYLDPVAENLAFDSYSLSEHLFTLDQLNGMVDIFQKIAPHFIILERNFAFLLQDLIVHQIEDGENVKVSPIWSYFETNHINLFTRKLFGFADYVDWREFIIQNISLRFPNETELLEARKQLRELDPDLTEIVMSYQFYSIEFWFERETKSNKSCLMKIKKLLARLYRVKEDSINYTRLLLALCKDEHFVLGIAKALELSLGKYVCWDEIEGIKYIENIKEDRRKQEEHKKNIEMIQQILNEVICENTDGDDSLDLYSVEEEEESSSFTVFTESTDDCEKVYFLNYHTMIVVLFTSLPCLLKTNIQNQCNIKRLLHEIYKECRNEEFDGRVFIHEFLHHKNIAQLFHYNQRFIEKKPALILNQILNT